MVLLLLVAAAPLAAKLKILELAPLLTVGAALGAPNVVELVAAAEGLDALGVDDPTPKGLNPGGAVADEESPRRNGFTGSAAGVG